VILKNVWNFQWFVKPGAAGSRWAVFIFSILVMFYLVITAGSHENYLNYKLAGEWYSKNMGEYQRAHLHWV
jgi:hypothetical protein